MTCHCPCCGLELWLHDTMDDYPPIPYTAWPERWSISFDGERWVTFCPGCDEDLDATLIAVDLDLPIDYPWKAATA